ncbi:hypothetical protein OWT79_10540 [Bacteroides fragilis]|nr:hypothetical protein [Bacteroides fragilis]
MENKKNDNSQRMIAEAIRKIALGRSMERINMSPCGTAGVGTARMIHGYVAKINNEDDEYLGTIDVGEFPDETASSEPIIHRGILMAGIQDNSGGFLIIPTLFSDVTIVTDAATKYSYVLNYSHAEIIQLRAHTETSIGVSQTEELDPEDSNSPDYDKLPETGNKTVTRYTATDIQTIVQNKAGEKAEVLLTPGSIQQKVDQSEICITGNKVKQKVDNTTITVQKNKVTIGEESATEPLVLGNQLAQLMLEFLTECSKISTPTLIGTMPTLNMPNFASLTSKIQNFLSQTAYTK